MKRVVLCAVLVTWSTLASAVVYKWVDAQGKVMYGDRPPDGVHAQVVELLGTHPGHTSPTPSPAPKANPETPPTDVKQEVAKDVAESRDKQCADAQEQYKKLIEGRRLYKTGENGEREYLTSEEIDAERTNAKRTVDEICNSAT